MKSFSLARILAVTGLLLALLAVGTTSGAAHAAARPGILPASQALSISPASQVQRIKPLRSFVYFYQVSNSSAIPEAVWLTATDDFGWPITLSTVHVVVPANGSVDFKVGVTVPLLTSTADNVVRISAVGATSGSVAYLTLTARTPIPHP